MVSIPMKGPSPSIGSTDVLHRAALRDIVAERVAQIDEHGFTIEHDLGHRASELVAAAASYLDTACDQLEGRDWPSTEHPDTWPWEREAWKPGDARTNLVKAIAIAWAAIDRIDAGAGAVA